ncbi:putative DNA-binding protein [Bacteroides fragilis str. S38L5]|nr:putative DNA-binding protein [Bacteroides fragilis str. S38L5]EYB13900.1 putative DNA-binding protein [Bacteroides fragilis str. S38L3]
MYFCKVIQYVTMKLNRIKTILVDKDLSQKWLSEQIGKSFSTTNAYCCNRQQPNLETLYKIAQLLSVELKDLIVDGKIEDK